MLPNYGKASMNAEVHIHTKELLRCMHNTLNGTAILIVNKRHIRCAHVAVECHMAFSVMHIPEKFETVTYRCVQVQLGLQLDCNSYILG